MVGSDLYCTCVIDNVVEHARLMMEGAVKEGIRKLEKITSADLLCSLRYVCDSVAGRALANYASCFAFSAASLEVRKQAEEGFTKELLNTPRGENANFTNYALQALQGAKQIAQNLKHETVASSHLLLSILYYLDNNSPPHKMLKKLNIQRSKLAMDVWKGMGYLVNPLEKELREKDEQENNKCTGVAVEDPQQAKVSSILSEQSKKLLRAASSMAPGGWSDDRYEKVKRMEKATTFSVVDETHNKADIPVVAYGKEDRVGDIIEAPGVSMVKSVIPILDSVGRKIGDCTMYNNGCGSVVFDTRLGKLDFKNCVLSFGPVPTEDPPVPTEDPPVPAPPVWTLDYSQIPTEEVDRLKAEFENYYKGPKTEDMVTAQPKALSWLNEVTGGGLPAPPTPEEALIRMQSVLQGKVAWAENSELEFYRKALDNLSKQRMNPNCFEWFDGWLDNELSSVKSWLLNWLSKLESPNPHQSWNEFIDSAGRTLVNYGRITLFEIDREISHIAELPSRLGLKNADIKEVTLTTEQKEKLYQQMFKSDVFAPYEESFKKTQELFDKITEERHAKGLGLEQRGKNEVEPSIEVKYEPVGVVGPVVVTYGDGSWERLFKKVEVLGLSSVMLPQSACQLDCPQGHHLKDGPCRRDYCHCTCDKCKTDCGEMGEKVSSVT